MMEVEKYLIVYLIKNNNMEQRIFDLELKMEHAQRDIEELKELIKKLSFSIADLQLQIIDLIDSK
jgi:uncharacterized coiled-coil protein SlyX